MRIILYFFLKIQKILQISSLRKKYYRSENEINNIFSSYKIDSHCVALDVGSGPNPKNPFEADLVYGADLRVNETNNVVYADLTSGHLSFEDNKFDFVTAYDVLEHIKRVSIVNGETKFPFINLMNEIFRVLKIGGTFFNIQPCYPCKEAFQDPTHVNIMTEDTIFLYFCQPAWARIYGYDGSFMMINEGWLGEKYFSFIKKSHDVPIRNLDFLQK